MAKKPNKKKEATLKYDSERETRVLLEQVRSEGKAVAEQYADIAKKLDKIDERLQKHDSVRFKLEWGIESLQSRVGTLDTKVDRIESELNTVKAAVMDVDGKVSKLDRKLDTVTQDYEDRLKKLEAVR